jgi:hypothetical protein
MINGGGKGEKTVKKRIKVFNKEIPKRIKGKLELTIGKHRNE